MKILPNSYQALLSEHNLALLGDWLTETQELFVIIDFPHSAGLQHFYIIESLRQLHKILSELTFPEIHIYIFREKKFPIRGQVSNSFIDQALESMVDGKLYTIIKLRTYPNTCEWVDASKSNQQIKEILESLIDEFVGFGIDPLETVNDKQPDTHTRFFSVNVSKNQNYYQPFAKEPERYAGILADWNKIPYTSAASQDCRVHRTSAGRCPPFRESLAQRRIWHQAVLSAKSRPCR